MATKTKETVAKKCSNKINVASKTCTQSVDKLPEIDVYYRELLEKIIAQKDLETRNPVDIGIECGYSEEDVKYAIGLLAQKIQNT